MANQYAPDSGVDPVQETESMLTAFNEIYARHDVAVAYLYGSQARGEAHSASDVDVAVLFQAQLSSAERFEQLLKLRSALTDRLQRPDVNLVDLAEASPLLRFEVYREGRLLYCQDEAARVDFLVTALRDYEDTRPLRQTQFQYLRHSIKADTFGRARLAVAEKKAHYGQD